MGMDKRPQIGQKAPQKEMREKTAQMVATGIARGEYSSHSVSIFFTYLGSGEKGGEGGHCGVGVGWYT